MKEGGLHRGWCYRVLFLDVDFNCPLPFPKEKDKEMGEG